MNKLSYEQVDRLTYDLYLAKRTDLERHVPYGAAAMTEAAFVFWTDVLATFGSGRALDAVTAIERRFEPRKPKDTDKEAMAARVAGKVAA